MMKALLWCGIVALLAGCASGPRLADIQSSIPQLHVEQSRVYFYRPSVMGALIQPSVMLDGSSVGTIRANGFFFVDVEPGRHEVSVQTEVEEKLVLTLAAGETRYVRFAIGLGIVVGRFYMQQVEAADAQGELAGLAYTGQDVAAMQPNPSNATPSKGETTNQATPVKLEDLQGLMGK
jgi:hypothetical protein